MNTMQNKARVTVTSNRLGLAIACLAHEVDRVRGAIARYESTLDAVRSGTLSASVLDATWDRTIGSL